MERWGSLPVHQTGGGGGGGGDDDDGDDDDDEISIADSGESDDSGFEDGENWVFNRVLQCINMDNEKFDLKQRQEVFRKKYADFLIWYHHLRQNTTHKKIMETAKELESSDYDKEEALYAAVEQRKFLLDRIVAAQSSVGGGDDDDADDDDDDAEAYKPLYHA